MSENLALPTKEIKPEECLNFDEKGKDSDGNTYESLDAVWKLFHIPIEREDSIGHLTSSGKNVSKWYTKAEEYWRSVDSTTNGMLGGFAFISKQDIRDSRKFLQEFLDGKYGFRLGTNAVLDCGAGIGRVSKFLLLPIFQRVDLLEQNGSFLEKAKSCLNSPKVGRYIQRGLQDFMFSELGGTSSSTEVSTCSSSIDSNDKEASSNFSFSGSYDLVWIQWVSGHLVDDHLVRCLRRCRKALSECGLIVIKENVCIDGHFHVDLVDSSLTRTDRHLRALFAQSGLNVIASRMQTGFPKELYPVYMYALR